MKVKAILTLAITLANTLLFFTITPVKAQKCIEPDSPQCRDDNQLNGYWWKYNHWVPGLITVDTWFLGVPKHTVGNALWYDQGVMEATAAYRTFKLNEIYANTGKITINYLGLEIGPIKDGIATMSCADLGLLTWLKRKGENWQGPYVVVDCAARQHMWPQVNYIGEVVEVGYKTAREWGMVETNDNVRDVKRWIEYGVEISTVHPDLITDEAVDYKSWWLSRVRFSEKYEWRPDYKPYRQWYKNGEYHTLPVRPGEITYEEYVRALQSLSR